MANNLNLASRQVGRDHLEYRSSLLKRMATVAPVTSILIIDDDEFDGEVLASMLRLIFGQEVRIRHVRFLRDIRRSLLDEMPRLLFLDDRLGHGTTAEVSLNQIKSTGCTCGVIVVSGMLTRARLIELKRLGVADIIHKDDINSARLSEAILKTLDEPPRVAASRA